MIKVHVKLFADLRQCTDGAPSADVEISEGETVAAVVKQLGIAPERIKIVFLNARSVPLSQPLQGGDELSLFSTVGGG